MKKKIIIICVLQISFALSQCDSLHTYFNQLPSNVTILVGDSCLNNNDINVLDSIIIKNELNYDSPLEIGTQTWFNGRLRFLVAGNYGNSSGVNDTIYSLPENIGDLNDLASLYLEWNRISRLPESFSDMENLFSLYINNNILTSIDEDIGDLTNLYFLDLGYNKLLYVPQSICTLENLSYLWLFNNELESLPGCFCDMSLDWSGNDNGGYPFFAIGANQLCEGVDSCIAESNNFELSLDQFYYSFPVYSPQDCEDMSITIKEHTLPYQITISPPYPNPFNPLVNFEITIPYDRKIEILVFDGTGKEVDQISNDEIFMMGVHHITWQADQHPSGIYYIQFKDSFETKIRKAILLK